MSVAFSKLRPGLVLLDIHRERMGNTKMQHLGCWNVRVISVDDTTRTALCSWNGNPARTYRERDFRRLYLKPTRAYLAQQELRAKR